METAELDVALEELETRLERLRSLYEQYFMGLEKIEPQIARKDVDRRIYVLRREKIRNTAKRFKLQTIIQRYNTFQQYWMRICREIENGTYKRHLLRAQKQNGELLTIAARKRLGRLARTSQPPEGASPSKPPSVAPSAPPSAPPLAAAVAPATPPPSAEPIAAAAPQRPLGSPPIPRRPPLPGRPAEPAALAAPAAPVAPAAAARPAPPPQPRPAPAKFESLDLDMDFMGDWDPAAKLAAPKPAAPSAARPPAPTVAKPAAPPAAKPTAPVVQAAPAPKPQAPAPAPAVRPASIPPAPVATPPRPASSRPPTAPARPLPPRVPASPRIPAAVPAPKPAAAAPPKPATAAAPAPKPAAPAAVAPKPATAAAAPKPAAAPSANVDDARLRDLHTKLQQAKQQTKEANVSFEGLAKSIRATEAKLREQHKNRKIDFDVVIKDGKAVVKPIVR